MTSRRSCKPKTLAFGGGQASEMETGVMETETTRIVATTSACCAEPALATLKNSTLAALALPWYQQRAIDAYRKCDEARRQLEDSRDDLAVVQAIARGDFDQEPTHATGSAGPLSAA